MNCQIDVVPLSAIPNTPEWDRTVEAANSPVFYSSRFLSSVAAAPLLPADSASLLWVHDNTDAVAGIPVFRQTGIDPLHHLALLYSEFPDLPSSSGLLSHCWHCYDSRIVSAGCEGEALQLLLDSLRTLARAVKADYFGLVNVADPRTLAAMAAAGVRPHYMVDRYVMDLTRYASFEDYVAALHPDSRRELRRQFRRYEDSGAELTLEAMPFRDLDEVVLLCRRTAARYDAEFYYPQEQTRLLLINMGDALRLTSIRYNRERVGVLVCFLDRLKLHSMMQSAQCSPRKNCFRNCTA